MEDPPVACGGYEGIIPKGEYSAGAVLILDQGEWKPKGDPGTGRDPWKDYFRVENNLRFSG
ncbi:MAG: hypothetical protein HZB87_12965 [Desulfatitalea sp.]|nr:hypothetical protein [Desulfatitalea sp.]MBI5894474.1 hypothetical protein [Desulfobacterales bacterium]